MKKNVLIICIFILLSGCNNEKNQVIKTENNNNSFFKIKDNKIDFEIEKIDSQYSEWQKHCSEKFRFEVQYPQDWMSDIGFISDENVGYQFTTLPKNRKPEKRSYFRILTTDKDMNINALEIKEKKNIVFLGYEATSYLFKDNDKRIVFKKDDIFFHIMIDSIITENETILDDILLSFRFLPDSEECREINKPKTTVLDNKIYYFGEKIGTVNNGKIFISFQGNLYSFSGDPKNLSKMNIVNIDDIYYYKGISINLPNKNREENNILYECTSSLLPSSPYFYCETNGEDYLTQYEFGKDYRQFSTGGGFALKWKKIYIRDIDGKDIVFEGILEGESYDYTDAPSQSEIQRIESKKYLDEIRKNALNKEKEKIWNDLVKSFSTEKE